MEESVYQPQNKVRIVTAASLFDGHDAAINVMRRIIQATGCEVIHLGHDRTAEEVVDTAIQEDANSIAMTSYQGGHNEYFKYMYDLLQQKGAGHIKIFAGGGGTILPEEIADLQAYGIARIYHPDDGRAMGLQGMINDLVKQSDFPKISLGTKHFAQSAGLFKNPLIILSLKKNLSGTFSSKISFNKIPLSFGCSIIDSKYPNKPCGSKPILVQYKRCLFCAETNVELIIIGLTPIALLKTFSHFSPIITFSSKKYFGFTSLSNLMYSQNKYD